MGVPRHFLPHGGSQKPCKWVSKATENGKKYKVSHKELPEEGKVSKGKLPSWPKSASGTSRPPSALRAPRQEKGTARQMS